MRRHSLQGSVFSEIVRTPLSRRTVLKMMGAGGVCVYLSGCSRWINPFRSGAGPLSEDLAGISPILRDPLPLFSSAFSGDQPEKPHAVLWDKAAFVASQRSHKNSGELPPPVERVPLVIVGGGIGGLLSAYLLRAHQPVILEQADRFGGNSKGESWEGIDYSIGAAYVCEPTKESALGRLMKEIGVFDLAQVSALENPVEIQGKLHSGFWQGATAPGLSGSFQKLHQYFLDVYHERNGHIFPDLPLPENEPKTAALFQSVMAQDRITFKSLLEGVTQGPLHPHLASLIENYCWSAFGGSAAEISGASGLNFLSSEFGPLLICPGGNAAIAENVLKKLMGVLPRNHFRTQTIVFDVQVTSEGVQVATVDETNQIRTLLAKAVVMACPKFVAAKVIPDLELERRSAIARLKYRSYVVANVLVKGKVAPSFYDLFLLGQARGWPKNGVAEATQAGAQDVILGTLASPNAEHTVLTLYKPLPYDGARAQLYVPEAFENHRRQFESQIAQSVLPLLGISKDRWQGLRIARWGHPIPLSEPGLIAEGVVKTLRKPFKDRVFFVSQDNWLLPSFETAASEALIFANRIRALIAG